MTVFCFFFCPCPPLHLLHFSAFLHSFRVFQNLHQYECKNVFSSLFFPFLLCSPPFFLCPFFVTVVFTIVFVIFFSPLSCFSYLYLYLLFYLYNYHNFNPFLACITSPILTQIATTQHTPTIHLYLTGPFPSHRVLPWI